MPRHAYPFIALVMLLLALAPAVQAAWTTTATAPLSFRPERDVVFTYTATSSSAADLPIAWRVTLHTCQDPDDDAWCEITDPHRIDHGERVINIVGGQSATLTWTVRLAMPEGPYRYHFHTVCINNPCTGLPPGGAHNKTGAFQLAYTDTWKREILTTTPTSQGAKQFVTYRLSSASPDDRDLVGTATLHSTPPGSGETPLGGREYEARANAETDVEWADVEFPEIGAHRLRVSDTNAPDATLAVTVRGVHLHVHQPRTTYSEGARVSLYFTLEGHGATPDPTGIPNADILLAITNGSFALFSTTFKTDAQGRAYASFAAPSDARRLAWRASTAGAWNGAAYDLIQEGTLDFVADEHAPIHENVTAVRDALSEIQLRGVHLDELGARNVWMSALRASGAVTLLVLLILLVVFIAFRV